MQIIHITRLVSDTTKDKIRSSSGELVFHKCILFTRQFHENLGIRISMSNCVSSVRCRIAFLATSGSYQIYITLVCLFGLSRLNPERCVKGWHCRLSQYFISYHAFDIYMCTKYGFVHSFEGPRDMMPRGHLSWNEEKPWTNLYLVHM